MNNLLKFDEFINEEKSNSDVIITFIDEGEFDKTISDTEGWSELDAYQVKRKDVENWASKKKLDTVEDMILGSDDYDNDEVDDLRSALDKNKVKSKNIKVIAYFEDSSSYGPIRVKDMNTKKEIKANTDTVFLYPAI